MLELLLQLGLTNVPLEMLLVGLVVIAIIILVGRLVLRIAWRLVTIAAVLVGILFLLSTFVF